LEHRPVGIIGAGPAGLATAAALKSRGLDFEILDAGRGVGGIWDIDRDETPMYESAHFISSKTLSAFDGHSMPAGYPDYPRHDQILAYVTSFAHRHGLEDHATFGVRVQAARAAEGGGWEVELSEGGPRRYRALCVATGANWEPALPRVEGTFEGEAYHAFHYRSPDELSGKRVLIVGGGNSGCDIACDAARVAERALLSVRRGYHFVPKYVFGQPSDVFAHGGPPLPAWLERRVFGVLIRRLLVGDVTRFGLPRPDHAILESHPTMNTRVLHHLGHGDLEARSDVLALEGKTVRFTDGRVDEVDLVVWATGYRRTYPFFEEPVIDTGKAAHDLYLNLSHRRHDDLFFLGLFETDGAAYPILSRQGHIVAAALDRLPEKTRAAYDRRRTSAFPDVRGGRRYLDSARHAVYVHAQSYEKLLDREIARLGN
jgi:cation diffusion facilitator CzcD-associated flavoprotein CzcO